MESLTGAEGRRFEPYYRCCLFFLICDVCQMIGALPAVTVSR